MKWMLAVLVIAAGIAAVRILIALRKARAAAAEGDWDARLVKDLRAQGGNPFTDYEVDFFFNLPDEATAEVLRTSLSTEGFAVDVRAMGGEGASGYSVHALKRMRVSVPDMQAYSQRFRALAQLHGGHYDGWTTDPTRT